jgi:hypothetical protein
VAPSHPHFSKLSTGFHSTSKMGEPLVRGKSHQETEHWYRKENKEISSTLSKENLFFYSFTFIYWWGEVCELN